MLKVDRSIYLTKKELKQIQIITSSLTPSLYWEGKTGLKTGVAKKRTEIKTVIKRKLLKIHKNICIYCGIKDVDCVFDVEHFASKDVKSYPQFTFEPHNLLLSCEPCNQRFKKSLKTIRPRGLKAKYSDCRFSMYHPRLHEFKDHFKKAGKKKTRLFLPRTNEAKEFFKVFQIYERYELILNHLEFLINNKTTVINNRVRDICGYSARKKK